MRIRGRHYRTMESVEIEVKDGCIQRVTSSPEPGREQPIVGPGLIDLQINGFGGVDFNQNLTADRVRSVVKELWTEGVTTSYPTIITNGDTAIGEAAAAVCEACSSDPTAAAGIGGIHLEGPFITPVDGPRGAHPREYVQAPDWSLFSRWQSQSGGLIRIVTLSPEWEEADSFIEHCVRDGLVVGIGHTAADSEAVHRAVDAGATLATHLGNGAHLELPRHPNYIWAQLADDRLWASLIADGFHLPEDVLRVMLRAKQGRAIIVSDAVYLTGMPPGAYKTHVGGAVELTEAGKLHLAGDSRILAGSAQTQIFGLRHLVQSGIADLAAAWDMCSVKPAELMGLPAAAGLQAGAPADLLVVSPPDSGFAVLQTIKAGRVVFSAAETGPAGAET